MLYETYVRRDRMVLDPESLGQFVTLSMIAVALGMDAFSLGLSIGIRGLVFRKIYVISLLIGLFHFLMPLLGISIGRWLGEVMGTVAAYTGGVLLCALGINMIWSGFRGETARVSWNESSLWKMVLLSLGVSVDSLSTGLSLGLFSANTTLAASMLGIGGGVMAGIGLTVGRFAGRWLGDYGELVGGTILLSFGIKFLL